MKYAIVGAGIGGLTTALALEKIGVDYEIFEKAPKIDEVGAGIWLAPNALSVLQYLDVLDEVKVKGNTINQITLAQADLAPISDNDQDFIEEEFGFTTIAIHRAALQQLLFDKIPKEKIHLGKGFQSYEEHPNGNIKVKFEDDTIIETNYLLGADGIHSKVRKQLFPESKIRYSGQTCWRGVANFEMTSEFQHRGMELWGNQIRFGISKIAENKVYWFAVALDSPNQKDNRDQLQQKLVEMFKEFDPIVTQLILSTPIEKIVRNDIIDLALLDHWHHDNICLIGDAAHATTPNMGQGGAQAIEDAYYLSKMIVNDQGNKHNFKIFEGKRKKKVTTIVNQSWSTGKMAHWKYGQGFRNFVLKRVPKKVLQKKMIEMYQI
ncbi:FAD-dependent monooxygenase [Aquimarina spongiae]|uniref:2-polyprenyl-6-methoxyphenol hydroxylase n=1 Tax=Aquimarina spongiae TaxID=570521 RepID=A0A1M6CF76_9FLAO|nr:FAD-dependent monooxygenase [Aquimarina spongiae]SHI59636.1 2-polyprenyl-6-methoxyphenol hydroxylase [Aquimarina spongiae]